ncbi:MAG: NAD-dependent epimerase/dehydratase family protein [Ktedonobacteraceae bacterium]|nr:NAD-dependent epimerase/dehydratase family protein [Ktedonobacteraceae bacterium]
MKIAISGGAGFIGTALVRACLDAGHDVLVIDNLSSGTQESIDPRARFYHIDIRDEKLRTLLQNEHPDIVSYHVSPPQTSMPAEHLLTDADVHIRGLLNILDGCVNASVHKFIFASDGNDLYGHVTAAHLPLSEETPLCPHSSQAIGKAAGEWYVRYYTRRYGLKHTILRYADVYGKTPSKHTPLPLLPLHPLDYFIEALRQRQAPVIRGSGEAVRDHIFIEDVVSANLAALHLGENATLHISSGCGYSLNQLYHQVARSMGSKSRPLYLASASAEPASIILANTRAQQILGWQPAVSLSEGIERILRRSCQPDQSQAIHADPPVALHSHDVLSPGKS